MPQITTLSYQKRIYFYFALPVFYDSQTALHREK